MSGPHSSWILIVLLLLSELSFGEECLVTPYDEAYRGNDALAVVPPADGKFVFHPQGPGFIDHDGALGIKVGWHVKTQGLLEVTGRRLDGTAPRARAYTSYLTSAPGGQSTYLIFPTPGCWEIVASVGQQSLTFVVAVEFIAPGPSSHMNGVPRGWRQTGG